MPGNLLYARGGSLLIIILCAAFSPGKTKESIVVGGKKALSDLWEIVLLVIYERVSTMKLEAIWRLSPYAPHANARFKREKKGASQLFEHSFRSFLLGCVFNSGPAHYCPSLLSPLTRGPAEHDPVMSVIIDSCAQGITLSRTLIMEFRRTWPAAPSYRLLLLFLPRCRCVRIRAIS